MYGNAYGLHDTYSLLVLGVYIQEHNFETSSEQVQLDHADIYRQLSEFVCAVFVSWMLN